MQLDRKEWEKNHQRFLADNNYHQPRLLFSLGSDNHYIILHKASVLSSLDLTYLIKVYFQSTTCFYFPVKTSLVAQMVKNLPAMWRPRFDPWVGKISWKRAWQPTPLFLPREFHGQRSLVGYSPWGHNKWDTTKWLTLSPVFTTFTVYISIMSVTGISYTNICSKTPKTQKHNWMLTIFFKSKQKKQKACTMSRAKRKLYLWLDFLRKGKKKKKKNPTKNPPIINLETAS